MIRLAILIGILSGYNQVPTDATTAYNQERGLIEQDLSQYDGVISVRDCEYVGGSAYLWADQDVYRMKVFDCANPLDGGDVWMDDNGVVAEVGYYFWEEHPELVLSDDVALFLGCNDFERSEICQIMHDMSTQ